MITNSHARQLVVRSLSTRAATGWLEFGGLTFPCALGRSGKTTRKHEGDGASPIGVWRPVALLYRADRMLRPRSPLPTRPIRQTDGWCDDPANRNYNCPVTHPYPASAEHLWRDDDIYDLIVVLDHNTGPRKKGAGSAIFMHLARTGFKPTEGCIALKRSHLKFLLRDLTPQSNIRI